MNKYDERIRFEPLKEYFGETVIKTSKIYCLLKIEN